MNSAVRICFIRAGEHSLITFFQKLNQIYFDLIVQEMVDISTFKNDVKNW